MHFYIAYSEPRGQKNMVIIKNCEIIDLHNSQRNRAFHMIVGLQTNIRKANGIVNILPV